MGRLTHQVDQSFVFNAYANTYDRTVTYDSAGRIHTDTVSQRQGADTYLTVTTNSYGAGQEFRGHYT